jgi:hypothetical protein
MRRDRDAAVFAFAIGILTLSKYLILMKTDPVLIAVRQQKFSSAAADSVGRIK